MHDAKTAQKNFIKKAIECAEKYAIEKKHLTMESLRFKELKKTQSWMPDTKLKTFKSDLAELEDRACTMRAAQMACVSMTFNQWMRKCRAFNVGVAAVTSPISR